MLTEEQDAIEHRSVAMETEVTGFVLQSDQSSFSRASTSRRQPLQDATRVWDFGPKGFGIVFDCAEQTGKTHAG